MTDARGQALEAAAHDTADPDIWTIAGRPDELGDAAKVEILRKAIAAAGPHFTARDRDFLDQAEYVLHGVALDLIAHHHLLAEPFTDQPDLSPWSRSTGKLARQAHDLAIALRKHLGMPYRRGSSALGVPPLDPEHVAQAAAAGERERLAKVIPAERFRKLADWFDTDDEFKMTMFPETWPAGSRPSEVQQDLRKFADLLDGLE